MRILFLGTPRFAVPTLEALARVHEIVLVVAQPDKPAGRGMHLQAPAVAVKAKELGLPLAQPLKARDPEFLARVAELNADAGVVIAYGKILVASLLALPRFGFLNVHASILPYYRGAAPIQRAIERGEPETGVTIMRVDEELDHGAIFAIERTAIGPDERTPSLSARLSTLGADALLPVLDQLANGTAVETPQQHELATYAAKIEKEEGHVRWSDSARTIYDKFRAFDPWPGVFTDNFRLIELARASGDGVPGSVLSIDDEGVVVACGEGALRVVTLQRAGKPKMSAADYVRAGRLKSL
ncbi:MAG: methionyl-tRNA formyltransferase [Acidobacteriota bacterium]|nr:methionyl-tRNA formyltransferase [Acidobacteriota bacterium]